MRPLVLGLLCLPSLVWAQFTIPEVRYEEPKLRSASDDPVIWLILAALVLALLAVAAYRKKERNKDHVAGFACLSAASVGLGLFWPKFFGESIPFSALDGAPLDKLWQVFQTPVIVAGILGVGVYVAVTLLVEGHERETKKPEPQTPASSVDTRPRVLTTGDRIKVYKGYEIFKGETGVVVNNKAYSGLLAAERSIDELTKTEH